MTGSPGFRDLAARLVRHLGEMVRRGEISERGLARLARYSQPHVHNVLKGTRSVTMDLADQIGSLLEISPLSLFTQDELSGRAPRGLSGWLPIPLLDGYLGGGKAFPKTTPLCQQRLFPVSEMTEAVGAVLVRVDLSEGSMWPTICAGDLVLLDRSPVERRKPTVDHIYALAWRGKGFLGRCRRAGRGLAVVTDNARARSVTPSTISLGNRDILDVVKGKVVWLARGMA